MILIQEEISNKTIVVAIKTGKLTLRVLRRAISVLLKAMKDGLNQRKINQQAKKSGMIYQGKTSLRQLRNQGLELSSVEVTNDNIKGFERYARKYNVDFSLKKDRSTDPPTYYVFFRARDEKLMEAAFKEFTTDVVKKRPSVRRKLEKALQQQKSKQLERVKTLLKDRGEVL